MHDINNLLRNLDLFRGLSEREMKKISPYLEVVHVPNKQMVFLKGEPIENIFLILYGSVKIQETLDKRTTKIFNFLTQKEFLGVAMAGLPQPRYPACAQSNEDSTLLKIPLHLFFNVLIKIPEIRQAVAQQISERFLEFQNDLCRAQKLAPYRIADFLLRLLDRQGSSSHGRIVIPLSRSDIADRVGVQSETVIRILSNWTKRGLIRTQDHHIEILNRQNLLEVRRERPSKKASRGASDDSADDRCKRGHL